MDGASEKWCTAEAPFGVIWQPRTRAKGEAHARTSRQLSGGFVSFFHERYSRTVVLLIAMGASATQPGGQPGRVRPGARR